LRSRPSSAKRSREQQRAARKVEKSEKRGVRKDERKQRPTPAEGEDPDLAGIIPGPQPSIDDAGPDGWVASGD